MISNLLGTSKRIFISKVGVHVYRLTNTNRSHRVNIEYSEFEFKNRISIRALTGVNGAHRIYSDDNGARTECRQRPSVWDASRRAGLHLRVQQ